LSKGPCKLAEAWTFGVASVGLTEAANRRLSKALRLPGDQRCTLALQSDDFVLLKSVTMQTDTILISTAPAVQSDIDAGMLVRLAVVDFPVMSARFGIVTLRRRTPSPMAKRVMECVKRAAREHAETR
jgi:DNA-binding transcriptional LysR family regulator